MKFMMALFLILAVGSGLLGCDQSDATISQSDATTSTEAPSFIKVGKTYVMSGWGEEHSIKVLDIDRGWIKVEVTPRGSGSRGEPKIVWFNLDLIMVLEEEEEKVAAAQIAKIKQDIRVLEGALNLYKLDNYFYPTTEQGLEALVQKPTIPPEPVRWKKYIDRLPTDSWGTPYQYLNPGKHRNIDIYSLGADSQPGGEGNNRDIGNWMD